MAFLYPGSACETCSKSMALTWINSLSLVIHALSFGVRFGLSCRYIYNVWQKKFPTFAETRKMQTRIERLVRLKLLSGNSVPLTMSKIPILWTSPKRKRTWCQSYYHDKTFSMVLWTPSMFGTEKVRVLVNCNQILYRQLNPLPLNSPLERCYQ